MVGSLFVALSSLKEFMIASQARLAKRSDTGTDIGDHPWRKQGRHALQDFAAQEGEVMGDGRARNAHIQGAVAQGIRPRMLAQEVPADVGINQEDALLAPAPASPDIPDHGGHQRRGEFGFTPATAGTRLQCHGGKVYPSLSCWQARQLGGIVETCHLKLLPRMPRQGPLVPIPRR